MDLLCFLFAIYVRKFIQPYISYFDLKYLKNSQQLILFFLYSKYLWTFRAPHICKLFAKFATTRTDVKFSQYGTVCSTAVQMLYLTFFVYGVLLSALPSECGQSKYRYSTGGTVNTPTGHLPHTTKSAAPVPILYVITNISISSISPTVLSFMQSYVMNRHELLHADCGPFPHHAT